MIRISANEVLGLLPQAAEDPYHRRLHREVQALRASGHYDRALGVVDAVRRAQAAGLPTVPALRTSELALFYLAGVSDVDPIAEGLDGTFAVGTLGAPTWLWFASCEGAHQSPCVPLAVLARRQSPSQVRAATRWRDDAPAELRALDAWRRTRGEGGPGPVDNVVATWDDLVVRQALRTPGAEERNIYGKVRATDPTGPRSPEMVFARTGGVPVFEDDLLAFARGTLAVEGTAKLAELRRAVRRGDRETLVGAFGVRPSETLDALVSYGRHTIPRSVAIGEARLELARAASVRWCAAEYENAMVQWSETTEGGLVT